MMWIDFSRGWQTSAGPLFVRHRVYWNGRWTPLVLLRFRYVGDFWALESPRPEVQSLWKRSSFAQLKRDDQRRGTDG